MLRLFILFLFSSFSAIAATEMPDPYFVSLKASETNVRTGPSVRYPIKWLYKKQYWPVEVVASFEGWRKIRDMDNQEGWIHESMLSRKRRVVIHANEVQEVFKLPLQTATVVFMAESGVMADLDNCKSNWCKIEAEDHEGWIEARYLWGVYPDEVVE